MYRDDPTVWMEAYGEEIDDVKDSDRRMKCGVWGFLGMSLALIAGVGIVALIRVMGR